MDPIKLNIKTAAGGKHEVTVSSLDETVAAFKVRLASVVDIPADAQRLIFRGHVLKDEITLQAVKDAHALADGHTMHVVRSARAAPPRQQPTAPSTSNLPQPQTQTQPATGQAAGVPNAANPFAMFGGAGGGNAQPGTNPMEGLVGMMNGAGGGMDNMAEMQRQLLQNPEQLQAMMNSPIMESLMNNPEMARSLMMANPQVRRIMENNPEVAHVLNDSGTFRQMLQMGRNPSLMNEMMRNTDRQMANIEMMPGGFDALRRMHENIQAPLMDATAGGLGGTNNQNPTTGTWPDANPFASLFEDNNTPSNAPMPNPWAQRGTGQTATRPAAAPNAQTTSSGTGTGATPGATPPNPITSAFANLPGLNGAPSGDGTGAPGTGGLPGMPNMNYDQMMQMLENPMVQTMMESVLSDPAMLESMIASNPELQSVMQTNPGFANILRDPAAMRTFLNPGVMRATMQMRQAMQQATEGTAGGAQTTTGATPAAPRASPNEGTGTGTAALGTDSATTGTAPQAAGTGPGTTQGAAPGMPDVEQIMSLLAAMNGSGGGGATGSGTGGMGMPAPQPPPVLTDEQLEPQVAQLRDMGFLDRNMCLEALRQSRGNVNLAVEHLLSRF